MVVSIWGNDLILHAKGSFLMGDHTRRTLNRADGLIADTARDIRLGHEWGFAADKPTLVVPGSGGVRLDEINNSKPRELPEEFADATIVVNPRGQRPGSLRQDVFFRSIPLVLEKSPQTLFICPNMAGDPESEGIVTVTGNPIKHKIMAAPGPGATMDPAEKGQGICFAKHSRRDAQLPAGSNGMRGFPGSWQYRVDAGMGRNGRQRHIGRCKITRCGCQRNP